MAAGLVELRDDVRIASPMPGTSVSRSSVINLPSGSARAATLSAARE